MKLISMIGTSAATPTFAAIISLINDARYQRNKKPLGFLNPLLYQLRKVGYDVIQGNNKDWYCDAGFQAGRTKDLNFSSLNHATIVFTPKSP
jgi:tripeptidyl-peptidase-1